MSKPGNEIPKGQPQEVIGGGLTPGVIAQIQKREELIQVKNNEHLLFFNGNGAWARLVSSINTISEQEANDLAGGKKSIKDTVGDNSLAWNNVLMGGTLKQGTKSNPTRLPGGVDEGSHTPIELDKNGYVKADGSKDIKAGAYNNYKDGLGFRPSPGIESVTVESKGSYGTLREASIKVKVWSVEDLEVMQTLYLRPGYTVMLEWGHSLQLEGSDVENVYTLNNTIELYKKFLNDKINDPMLTFEKELATIRAESSYNYDSFVGYVSNFNWSLTQDGGYDCSIKVIAKGSVLESIAVTFDPSNVYPPEQMTRYSEDKGKQERKSIYHKFFSEIKRWIDGGVNSAQVDNVVAAVTDVVQANVDNQILAAEDALNLLKGEGVKNQEEVVKNVVKQVAGVVVATKNAVGAAEDILFGSDEALQSSIDNASTAEAKISKSNEEFKRRIDKLANGDVIKYEGKDHPFSASTKDNNDNEGIAGSPVEEEEAVYYLNKNFGEYGLVFKEGTPKAALAGLRKDADGNSTVIFPDETFNTTPELFTEVTDGGLIDGSDEVYMYQASNPRNNRYVTLDILLPAKARRNSLRIQDFIQKFAIIPEDQLTDEQKADRAARKVKSEQEAANIASSKSLEKSTGADIKASTPSGTVAKIYTKGDLISQTSAHFKKSLNDFVAFRLIDLEDKDTGKLDNDNLNEFWIPLYTVLDIYNNYVSLVDTTQSTSKGTNTPGRKLTQFYTGNQDPEKTGNYKKKLKYLTGVNHFSINPMVCILPHPPKNTQLFDSEGRTYTWPDGQGESFPMGVVYKNGFAANVQGALSRGMMRGEPDDILNILISVEYLETELDKIVAEEEDSDNNSKNNIVKFIRTLLSSMNEAMGGINDLDLFYDDEDDLYYIVDRKITPALRHLIPTLSLSGIKSTMTNVSISSEISKDIGNMISIAAQGTEGNSRDNVSAMLKWNQGCLDRHTRFKAQKSDDSGAKTDQAAVEKRESPEDKRLRKWADDYYDYWREFNGDKWFDNGDFNRGAVAGLSNFHKQYTKTFVTELYCKDEKDPKPVPGVIPVELSFSTMGISGLKIGQAFMIEAGLLPQRYSEDFGYLITGLSHKIENSKWTTDVKTQFYYTKKSTPDEIAAYNKTKKTLSSPATTPSGGGGGENPGPVVPYNGSNATVPGDGSIIIAGGTFNQSRLGSRRQPIQQKLMDIIAGAAKATGLTFRISSAGQTPLPFTSGRNAVFTGDGKKGSTSTGTARHDNGYGVDGALYVSYPGEKLIAHQGPPLVQSFLTECRKRGLHSIGVGAKYMSGTSLHLDIAQGNSVYGQVFGPFTNKETKKAGLYPTWLKPLMKATKETSGPNKNYFAKSEGLKASNGKSYYTGGY